MAKFTKFLLAVCTLGLVAFTVTDREEEKLEEVSQTIFEQHEGITFPENVKAIIDAKCMGCHKPDARNEKAKKKLQWEKVPKMNKEEQEHLISELFEVLEEGKMPPKKMVKRKPKMKLTDDETKTLLAWAEVEEKRLKGN